MRAANEMIDRHVAALFWFCLLSLISSLNVLSLSTFDSRTIAAAGQVARLPVDCSADACCLFVANSDFAMLLVVLLNLVVCKALL